MTHWKRIAHYANWFKVELEHNSWTVKSIIFVVRTAEKEEIEEVLDQITKENGLLKEKAERADVLAEVIHELMPDDEWLLHSFIPPYFCHFLSHTAQI